MNNVQGLNSLAGERGIPNINDGSRQSGFASSTRLMVFVLIILFCLGGCAVYWKHKQNKEKAKEAAQQKVAMRVNKSVKTFDDTPPTPVSKEPTITNQATTPQSGNKVNVPPLPEANSDPMIDRSASELMVSGNRGGTSRAFSPGQRMKDSNAQNGDGNEESLSGMLTATQTSAVSAGHIGDRNFILAKGSFIDCALQTKLDSTVPGMIACVVTRNIYSDNGKVLLIERGSTVIGEYKSNLRQGMERIFVLWTRIKTPKGITINVDSPGSDPLGGSGLPGYVDTHFWKRFGGALMLSLIGDVSRYATTRDINHNSGNISFEDTSDATEEMAAETLRNTINIPPTLYKNQGEQVGIFVARDLDFSRVYHVRTKLH